MKKIFLCLSILILAGAGCQFTSKDEGSIQIGVIAPLTGGTAIHGMRALHGVEIAIDEINEDGGVDGRMIELVIEDSACEAKNGVAAAQKLIAQGIKILLGPQCSSVAMAVAPIAEQNEVLMFSSIASVPDLKYAGEFIFRNSVTGAVHGKRMAAFAYKELGLKTASILYINLDNGVAYDSSFTEEFELLGGRVVGHEAYEKGTADFRAQITKIKQQNQDVIYIGGQSAQIAIKQIRELGVDAQILSMNGIESQEVLDVAGDAAEGIYFTSSAFDKESNRDAVTAFVTKYNNRYDDTVEAFSANGYDAGHIIAKALRSCDVDTVCIRDYLYSVKDYLGVSGKTSFDAFGEVDKPLRIKQVRDGGFVATDF